MLVLNPIYHMPPPPTTNAQVLAAVARQNAHLDALMGVSIATLPCAMSSQHVRFEPSGMATWLLSKVIRALCFVLCVLYPSHAHPNPSLNFLQRPSNTPPTLLQRPSHILPPRCTEHTWHPTARTSP